MARSRTARDDMVSIPGGEFRMGSNRFYPEERPVRTMRVDAFELDRHAVTNREFRRFVEETGYVTIAERPVDPATVPGPALARHDPGSLVFVSTPGPVDLTDWRQWWRWVPGVSWRHPRGPESDIDGLDDHPVVQVAYPDASAYAAWAGKRLPTEAEWEYAARGGLDGATFVWGEEANGPERLHANTWQGDFPYRNAGANGWSGTCPVGSFEPNGYGLYEMTGNTWEWTDDYWSDRRGSPDPSCTCSPEGARSASVAAGEIVPRRVLKGGSHLCAPNYCLRYRPAARSPQAEDSATTHIGFRCAR